MFTTPKFLLKALAGAALIVGISLPLAAQLDPKLQKSQTDFLDLYQQTGVAVLKPEIYSLIDSSSSMEELSFHELFPNNWDNELPSPNDETANSRHYNLYVRIKNTSGTYSIDWVGFGRLNVVSTNASGSKAAPGSASGASYVQASATWYPIGGTRTPVTVGSNTYYTNTLIKPDGSEVTEADANTARPANFYNPTVSGHNPKEYAVNWVTCASHIRLRCTVGTHTRNVDFPINWAVIDMDDNGSTTGPLTPLKVLNPTTKGGDGNSYDIDTLYKTVTNPDRSGYIHQINALVAEIGAGTYPNDGTGTTATSTTGCGDSSSGMNEVGISLYRSRYIEWIFWGLDTTGRYCIPNAIPSSDTTVLHAIDPTSIVYLPSTNSFQTFSATEDPKPAFLNKLPNRSRLQAVKEAHVKAWFNNQDKVLWAWRIFTPDTTHYLSQTSMTELTALTGLTIVPGAGTPLASSQKAAYLQMMSSTFFSAQESSYTSAQLQCQKHFLILCTDGAPNDSPSEGTYDKYPYLFTTSNSAYATYVYGNSKFRPGSSYSSTYVNTPTYAGVAAHGGAAESTTWICNPSTPNSSTKLPYWITQRTNSSATVTLSPAHCIQTMTLGVSLGVSYLKVSDNSAWPSANPVNPIVAPGDTPSGSMAKVKPIQTDMTGAKFRLLMAALAGDPGRTSTSPTPADVRPFYTVTNSGKEVKASNATYYFDGRDPKSLVDNLEKAFKVIFDISKINTSTAPVIPFVGVGLGQQVYITRFIPTSTNSPIWTGDMKMFSTRLSGDTLTILDNTGAVVTSLDTATSDWSADERLRGTLWSSRHVWTRLPSTTGLVALTPLNGTGTAFDDIKSSIATGVTGSTADTEKQDLIAWLLGADTSDDTYRDATSGAINSACPNRTTYGDILGDIINSTPASVEYTLDTDIAGHPIAKFNGTDLPSRLATQVTNALSASATPHFRLIFVGTNRGFLHAFGEVTYTYTDTTVTPNTRIVRGDATELWAFMPTDFLANLNYLNASGTGQHYYGVDGTPYVYFLDLPSTGASSGNYKIDPGEKAVVVCGLRKGGRSYYGLDICDPFTPYCGETGKLGWALRPDEASSLTDGNLDSDIASTVTLTNVKSIVGNMGFSTCVPEVGRVLSGASPKVRDVLFLGGGHSLPLVDQTALPAPGMNWPALGRSALALDVKTGKIMSAWNFSSLGMGPVSSGLVPFEFFVNSGMVQRAYFTDYKGGLWVLGSGKTNSSGQYTSFRRDSNALDQWTVDGARGSTLKVRKVYQDNGGTWGSTTLANNSIYSTRPAPFMIGNYPGLASWTYNSATVTAYPAAVGIVLESGDRDNPLDKGYTSTTLPTQHRLTVVFDRQDSARSGLGLTHATPAVEDGVIKDTNLSDFTSQTTAPASSWLNDNGTSTQWGYYLNFPAASGSFVTKGIYEPIVLSKVLFYSYFTPEAVSCSGGSGATKTVRICDVLFPAWPGAETAAATGPGCTSGRVSSWIGVASPLGALSTATAIQSGIQSYIPSGGSDAVNAIQINIYQGGIGEKYPRVRTWRSVR